MGFLGTVGNLISDGLGDKINAFADDIGLNRAGGGGGGGESRYTTGLQHTGIGRASAGSGGGVGPMAAPGFQALDAGGGNAMNMTAQQWDEQARQAGFRDANQMRQWQQQQNAGRGEAQAQRQSLPQQILDRIGQGISNAIGMHPKELINRATDALGGATGNDGGWGR